MYEEVPPTKAEIAGIILVAILLFPIFSTAVIFSWFMFFSMIWSML